MTGARIVVETVAESSLGSISEALLPAVTVFRTEPELASTVTTTVKLLVAPLAKDAFEQLIAPLAPTAGVVQLQPPGVVIDWKPTEAGRIWLNVALVAVSGPAFCDRLRVRDRAARRDGIGRIGVRHRQVRIRYVVRGGDGHGVVGSVRVGNVVRRREGLGDVVIAIGMEVVAGVGHDREYGHASVCK